MVEKKSICSLLNKQINKYSKNGWQERNNDIKKKKKKIMNVIKTNRRL